MSDMETNQNEVETGTENIFENQNDNTQELEPVQQIEKPLNMSPGAVKLRSWLNKPLRIDMTDGRILIGIFVCTDRDSNIILGTCSEYLSKEDLNSNESRILGLVMVPGKHIVSIYLDELQQMLDNLNPEDVI